MVTILVVYVASTLAAPVVKIIVCRV